MAKNPYQISDRVQDRDGFTGTITARWPEGVEITWDISGCASEIERLDEIGPMNLGQDDKEVQSALHTKIFGDDE